VRFFKLYLVLVSISDWGRNGDSDGRRTGGGAGGKGVHGWDGGGGGGSEDGGDKSDGIFGRNDVDGWAGGVYARNMSKRSRWDRDGGGLRSRRSAAKGHYVVAHQSEQGMSNPSKHKLKTNDTCKPKTDANLIIVHEYMLTSAKLEGTVPAGGCEILLNGPTEGMWKNQEGFDVNGEMEGVSISDRKFGNEAKEKQKQKKKRQKWTSICAWIWRQGRSTLPFRRDSSAMMRGHSCAAAVKPCALVRVLNATASITVSMAAMRSHGDATL